MKKLWSWHAILAILAVASWSVAVGAVFLRHNALNPVTSKISTTGVPLSESGFFHYACKTGDSPDSLPCLQQHYQDLTKSKGPAVAFVELKAAYNSDVSVKADCHPLTHVIGRTAALTSKSIGEAFTHGDQFCSAGYYHGVMETYLSKIGPKDLPAKLISVCADIKAKAPYAFDHYNCVHGLGHGIMAVQGNDLFKSLQLCNSAGNNWEQQSCQGGVFMQNVMANLTPGDHTAYLKPDKPMYPCTDVQDNAKSQCYGMQSSYALEQSGQNFSVVFAECKSIAGDFRTDCYQGLGRDASGNSISDVAKTKATCMLGPDQEAQSNCIIGAVKDFVGYFHGDSQAEQLCQAVDPSIQPQCEQTKQVYYKAL